MEQSIEHCTDKYIIKLICKYTLIRVFSENETDINTHTIRSYAYSYISKHTSVRGFIATHRRQIKYHS